MSKLDDPKTEILVKLTGLAVFYNLGNEPTDETWSDLFARYDANHDGYLTHEEMTALFLDAEISKDSWWPWLRRRATVTAVIEAADERGERDNKVSLAEFQGSVRSMTTPDLIEAGVKRANRLIEDEFTPPSLGGAIASGFTLGWAVFAGVAAWALFGGRR